MRLSKKIKLFIILGVGMAAVVVAFVLFSHSSDYLGVEQFQPKSESYYGRQVSISGKVAPGSVDWDEKSQIMKFELAQGSARLPVRYQGLVPDNFKPGSDIVVNGKYCSDNVLQAVSFGKIRSLCSLCH